MKKPNLTKKLTLAKETLRMLENEDLEAVAGGHSGTEATKCSKCPVRALCRRVGVTSSR